MRFLSLFLGFLLMKFLHGHLVSGKTIWADPNSAVDQVEVSPLFRVADPRDCGSDDQICSV